MQTTEPVEYFDYLGQPSTLPTLAMLSELKVV